MLSVTIEVQDSELRARLSAMPDRVRSALLKKCTELALKLEANVKRLLTDDVLHVRTGALRSSIDNEVTESASGVQGKVFAPGNVPYAAIHEFGGTIHIPEIVPTKAQALHFFVGSEEIFAKFARAHNITMPERSYLRRGLKEMSGEIVEGLTEAVRGAVGEK